MTTADELICAVLRGESPAWPWCDEPAAVATLYERAEIHGVQSLLHAGLSASDWPSEIREEFRDQAVRRAMWELRHQQTLAHALAALEVIGIQPVLIKGTALAYSLYPNPVMRTRGDTDLIIPVDAKERVHEALTSLGYARSFGVSGEFISYQANYTLQVGDGSSHTLDLHWKINNSELLSRLFSYGELRYDAQPLPELSPQALGASQMHALLLACMHRSTHKQNPYYIDGQSHYDADRLIWLYDIHLLASQFTSREWGEFVHLAQQKGLRAICLEGMQHAQARFHSVYPKEVLAALTRKGKPEPPAQYLDGSKLRQQWTDFRALGNLNHQLRFARELLFPPSSYMRERYPQTPFGWLPWLYLRRAANGLAKGFGASRSAS